MRQVTQRLSNRVGFRFRNGSVQLLDGYGERLILCRCRGLLTLMVARNLPNESQAARTCTGLFVRVNSGVSLLLVDGRR